MASRISKVFMTGWFTKLGFALVLGLTGQLVRAEVVEFPKGFTWCVSTAAHQIEGNNTNSDHYLWELSPDRVISSAFVTPAHPGLLPQPMCPSVAQSQDPDPMRLHTLQFSGTQPGTFKLCEYSGRATDHWNRIEEDTQLVKQLQVGQYRLSVEWAKIEPKQGQFNQEALDHYRYEILHLRSQGLEPLVTLFHFTLPQWLRDRGGWEDPAAPMLFERFTKKVYSALGDQVMMWFTLNEPVVHIFAGYVAGVLPPGQKDLKKIFVPLTGLLKAHGRAYRALHALSAAAGREVKVGVAHHLRVFEPAQPLNPLDQLGARWADDVFNWAFVTALETGRLSIHVPMLLWEDAEVEEARLSQDFLGVNYYSRDLIHLDPLAKDKMQIQLDPKAVSEKRLTDMGWEVYPDGLRQVLKTANSKVLGATGRKLKTFIAENGVADYRDQFRRQFLGQHLRALRQAMNEGVEVTGFCHWTLVDNFEWNSGYYPKFGFFEMNPHTFERRARPSAEWYAELARTGRFLLDK